MCATRFAVTNHKTDYRLVGAKKTWYPHQVFKKNLVPTPGF
jgi:hypothetical protein